MSTLSDAIGRAAPSTVPAPLTASKVDRDDPLADAEQLIRRIYAYVAYRIGDGPEAEDVVAATFERAVRYRNRYSRRRGEPIAWLVGIARHCMSDAVAARVPTVDLTEGAGGYVHLEDVMIDHLELREAVSRLPKRDQELIALRYGADLSAKSIAKLIDSRTNTVEVALHRALGRLRAELAPEPNKAVA